MAPTHLLLVRPENAYKILNKALKRIQEHFPPFEMSDSIFSTLLESAYSLSLPRNEDFDMEETLRTDHIDFQAGVISDHFTPTEGARPTEDENSLDSLLYNLSIQFNDGNA
jgi:hypothetical protein